MKVTVTTVNLLDDLANSNGIELAADDTITLGYQGQWYALDLNEVNIKGLEKAIEKYIAVGRKIPRTIIVRKPSAAAERAARAEHLDVIRAWARTQKDYKFRNSVREGYHGRLARDIENAYNAAHPQG